MRLLWFALLALSVLLLLPGPDSGVPSSEAPCKGKIWGEFLSPDMPLVEAVDRAQQPGAGMDATGIILLWRVRLCGFKTAMATDSERYWLLKMLEDDDSLCLVIGYDQPGHFTCGVDYSLVEEIYDFLIDQGLYGKILTRHQPGVDVDKPEIFIAQRVHPVAEESVPSGVVKLAEEFLVACVRRDQSAVELFSSRIRQTFNDEELQAFILGTSNPHHCGYFVHSVTPNQEGWSVVVSLFDHYTGHNLDLSPEKNQYSFDVIRKEQQYVIDSLPYVGAKTIQLVQDGTLYSLRLAEHHTWGNCYLPLQCTFTVHADSDLLYRFGSYWLTVERVKDVTGDGFRNVVLKGGMGG